MISLRRTWGVVSLLVILVSSLLTWPPSHAVRSPALYHGMAAMPPVGNEMIVEQIAVGQKISKNEAGVGSRGILADSLPAFHESPAFRNGKQCVNSRSKRKLEEVCDVSAVHIAMTLDAAYLRGSVAAIFSILKHSVCPENVIFHFIVSEGVDELGSLIQATFPYLRFRLYPFDENLVKSLISASVRSALEHPLNYARNYLAGMLEPCVERVIYLDSDLIVVHDIAELWSTDLGPHLLGAPEYCHANFTKYFTSGFWGDSALSSTFKDRNPCYFNTGVMVMDLAKWREKDYTRRIESWMSIQKEVRIYELGSLPPFLLVFAGSVQAIDHRWNQHGLGGDNLEGRCRDLHPGPVSLLHWSGKGKPWVRLDNHDPCPLDSLWAPYDLVFRSLRVFS